MNALFCLIITLLNIYWWVLFIYIIFGWLVNFGVINLHNQFVRMIYNAAAALTEPVLAPLRRIIPIISGLDLTPLVPLLLIPILTIFLQYDIAPLFGVVVTCR